MRIPALFVAVLSVAGALPTNETCIGGCSCKPRLSVCVPTAPSKDMRIFAKSLASIVAHVVDAEEVWVVSRASTDVDRVIAAVNGGRGGHSPTVRWLDEDGGNFPFDYGSVKRELETRGSHGTSGSYTYAVGWYLQQLLKLYCGRAVERASKRPAGLERVESAPSTWTSEETLAVPPFDTLVIDSDVVFLRDVAFVHAAAVQNARCGATYNYAFSREGHPRYYATNMALLGKADGRPTADAFGHDVSGVVHHMPMRADVVAEIELRIQRQHANRPLWEALLGPGVGVLEEPGANAFSEYQLYFHFARRFFPDSVRARQLYWANGPGQNAVVECSADGWPVAQQRAAKTPQEALAIDTRAGYDFAAYHSYAKRRPCVYAPDGRPGDGGGVCFGGGCPGSCIKSHNDKRFAQRDRVTAPRLCAPEH